jgi:hypothetical protein
MLLAMGLLAAMFLYPVLSLWRNGRKQCGESAGNLDGYNSAEDNPWVCAEPSARQTEAETQPDASTAPDSRQDQPHGPTYTETRQPTPHATGVSHLRTDRRL